MSYQIIKRTRRGHESPVYFAGRTLEVVAGAMEALTCGNRRHARTFLKRGQSYTASNSNGDFLTAEWVKP